MGTRTELKRKYTPIGVRPSGKQKIGYEYLYLYVSLKPFTGEMFALVLPRLNKECFNIFIKERSLSLSNKALMILDGAGAHRLEEAGEIRLGKLPAYAPELNPVERLFQELRKALANRIFETLEEAEKCVIEALQVYLKEPERVKQLTLYPYIKHAQYK